MPDETEDGPVLETLGAMTGASLERCDLAPDALLPVRIAALAAVDARPVSYLAHIGPAADAGVTLDDVQNVLVAVHHDKERRMVTRQDHGGCSPSWLSRCSRRPPSA